MAFSDEELERYQRHILLKELGGPGQQKLKSASVLVVGAGGLGAPLLFYLAAAGIGKIGIVDFDHVSLSNLQRQIIFATANVGELKTEAAAKALKALNPNVNVEIYSQRLTAENAADLISKYDVIADGSDNFATRYLVSDACFYHKKPLV